MRPSTLARLAAVGLAALSIHCSAGSPAQHPTAEDPILPEAGLIDVPARDVTLAGQPVHIEATARLFYNLRPADQGARDKPIFVLFNGFAAEVVRAFGTGPKTVEDGGAVVDNPSSLTSVANLLYVDPRQSGYSYDVLADRAPGPTDCDASIFNEYVDAADVLLAVLAFLDAHPELHGPVYWVGESYAGVRIQWILAYLRGRWDLAPYADPTLEKAIAKIDRQASLRAGQILLEAWLAGGAHTTANGKACDDPDLIAAVSASAGGPCTAMDACTCADAYERSRYNYTFTTTHQNAREYEASEAHTVPDRAAALLGVPVTSIAGLGSRSKGFKCSPPDDTTPPDDELQQLFGALPAGQAYYVAYSPLQPGKETAPTTRDWETRNYEATAFVDNLRDVPAFETDGRRDLVVPERALVPALRAVIGDGAVEDQGSSIVVTTAGGARTVEIGTYPSAGHMVTMIEPEAFARDVTAWLAKQGGGM